MFKINIPFGKKPIVQSNKKGQIVTKDDKIAKLLIEKKKTIQAGQGISRDIEKLEIERNKLALKAQKIKDKIMPFAKKIQRDSLSKYEAIQSIELKGKDIILTTFDYVEEYKKQLEEKIKKGEL